ncbi:DUF6397 family protein [Streptomyces sp. NBC_01178]|uniref:DUF6397 family protein n=1 Tax=Streptomyces sp. NBC_01178 TaxID=2903762 RepID=UPI003868D8A8|nr:DUF6397 family protein [Streptomyces sp. NBC_01178]
MTVSRALRVDAGGRNARAERGRVRAEGTRKGAGAPAVVTCAEGVGGRDGAVARTATVAPGRAVRELGLRRTEFELAVHLGLITVVTGPDGGRPRVHEEEIERLRELPGFPGSVAERVRTVGTAEGAALLGVPPARFTRLARAGRVSPVTFCLNRYRAVVWLYLADELAAFAAREPELLGGRMPEEMRAVLETGADLRARNWRSQRIDRLVNRSPDPWARAAAHASALDPVHLAEVVDDPCERAHLARVRPGPVFERPVPMAAREAVAELMAADDPDEILWRRINLTLEVDRAREHRPAPVPGSGAEASRIPAVEVVTGNGKSAGSGAGTGRRAAVATGSAHGREAAEVGLTSAVDSTPPVCTGASRAAVPGGPRAKRLLAGLGRRGRGEG